jgi:urease accessory protein
MTLVAEEAARTCLDLGFIRRNGKTVLERRRFTYPFTVSRLFHLDAKPSWMASVILQTISGSLNAGDHLLGRMLAGVGAAAHVRTQGATVVYRAPIGLAVSEQIELIVEDDAILEYLPQPRVLFPDSRFAQRTNVVLGERSTAILCEGFVTHDPLQTGRGFRQYETETTIKRPNGRLLAVDRTSIDRPPAACGRRASYRAFGVLTVATNASTEDLDLLCSAIRSGLACAEGTYWAVSPLPNGCGVSLRLAAVDGRAMRCAIDAGWVACRLHLFGHAPGLRALSH